jgi:hypothetical protein
MFVLFEMSRNFILLARVMRPTEITPGAGETVKVIELAFAINIISQIATAIGSFRRELAKHSSAKSNRTRPEDEGSQ